MQLFDFVSVKLTLFLIAGILIGFYMEPSIIFTISALLGFLILSWISWKKQPYPRSSLFEITVVGTTILLGVLITTVSLEKQLPHHYSNQKISEPAIWHLKIEEVLKPNPYSQRFVAQVIQHDESYSTGKIILSLSHDSLQRKPKVDDEIVLFSSVEEIKPPLNPHQFDYKMYLNKLGIYHQIRAKPAELTYSTDPSPTLFGHAMQFREIIVSKLKQHSFGEDELAVIQALLLGKRDDISEDIYNNYKNAGAVHILAVSGLHVGILLLIVQFLTTPLTRLPKGKFIQMIVIVFLLWSFAFVAGLSASIVRAVTMFSFVAYALHLKRPNNSFNIVALSMFFILLLKPLFLFQVGFQMSYAAVFAIIWIYPKLTKLWNPDFFVIRKVWQLLAVSVSAQLGVLPISLLYFHQFPALFFVSNLIVIPFLGIILGTGLIIITLTLMGGLPSFLVTAYNFAIKSMNTALGWVAQQEGFVLRDIPFDTTQLVLAYIALFGLISLLSRPSLKKAFVLCFGIIGLQVWGIYLQVQLKNQKKFIIAHSARTPLLLSQIGKQLTAYMGDSLSVKKMIQNFKIGEKLESVRYKTLQNVYEIEGKTIYRVDSAAVFPKQVDVDFLWLTESPKINLERWLDSLQPKMVISDGTNYRSYSQRWRETCHKRKPPFHDTHEKGAYIFIWNED
nr:ComEC/Rec2 family competence protein [Allomuricauda sp.]